MRGDPKVSDSHNLSHFGWSVSFDIFQSQQLRNKITCHWVERSHVECIAVCKHRSSSKMRLYIDRMLWSRMHLKETISSPWQEKISAGHQTVSGGSSSLPIASGCPIQVRQVAQPTHLPVSWATWRGCLQVSICSARPGIVSATALPGPSTGLDTCNRSSFLSADQETAEKHRSLFNDGLSQYPLG